MYTFVYNKIVLFIGLAFLLSCEGSTNSGGKLFNAKGTKIDFSVGEIKNLDNKTVSLKNLINQNDRTKLICFWATWCGPCNVEFNAIKDKYPIWKEKFDFEIIAISIDEEKMFSSLPAYIEHKQWPFEFYFDHQSILSEKLKIDFIPYSILVNPKGEVVHINSSYHEGFWGEVETMIKQFKDK